MTDPRIDKLKAELNKVERAIKIVGRKLDSVTGDVGTLEEKIHRDRTTVRNLIETRNALNGHSREHLLRYQEKIDRLAFASADLHIEQASRFKQQAVELSEQIGMIERRGSRYQKQVRVLGDRAAGLAVYVDNLVAKAQSLQSQAEHLSVDRIPQIENKVTSLRRQANEES